MPFSGGASNTGSCVVGHAAFPCPLTAELFFWCACMGRCCIPRRMNGYSCLPCSLIAGASWEAYSIGSPLVIDLVSRRLRRPANQCSQGELQLSEACKFKACVLFTGPRYPSSTRSACEPGLQRHGSGSLPRTVQATSCVSGDSVPRSRSMPSS